MTEVTVKHEYQQSFKCKKFMVNFFRKHPLADLEKSGLVNLAKTLLSLLEKGTLFPCHPFHFPASR